MPDPKEPAKRPLSDAQKDRVEELYAKCHNDVRRLAYYYLRNEEEAKEIVTDVFLRAMRHIDDFDLASRDPMPWFKLVTRQCCFDRIRRRRETLPIEDFPESGSKSNPSGMESSVILREAIRSCREALPDPFDFECLLMQIEKYTVEEIATTLGETVSQVRTRIQRAKKFMSACLESKGIGVDVSSIAE